MSFVHDPLTPAIVDRIAAETFVKGGELHDRLDSTNDRALQLAAQDGGTCPWLVLAEHQTRGRGRGTNRWWSAEGSLTFSLVLDAPGREGLSGPPPQVALAAGVSVCLAIHGLLPALSPGLKWPNDVCLSGRKVSGILIEVPQASSRRVVIGVGINVNNSFAEAPVPQRQIAISLLEATGQAQPRAELLVGFLHQLEKQLHFLHSEMPQMINTCRRYCVLKGRIVQCQVGPRQVRGRCEGIGHDGALLVVTPTGIQRCYSGVVELAG